MKVLYELDLNDIIRIVAEKYGVPQEKVKKSNKDGLNYLMIDMSKTETPEPTDEEQESKYNLITNEMLQALIVGGLTIPQICEKYDLKDSKYAARLYKRAEPFRKEGARLGRKRNPEKAQDSEPTAG